MAGFVEILVVAFVAQLAVLPGEKVQFIIAGLSTRFNPFVVVAAAGTAFAGWTALEIVVGDAIQGLLPGVVLTLVSAVLFLVFAVMLYRSAPAEGGTATTTDGGYTEFAGNREYSIGGFELPQSVATFVGIFSMMAVGEFGDKTQVVTFTLALEYGATPAIWAGEMLAIIPVSLANALFFHRFAHKLNLRKAHFVAAGLFLFFGLDTLLSVATGFSVWETLVDALAAIVLSFG
ncbi:MULTISPECIES: TMEM165/GDT1 family protein [Salinibaculum]|uniref:TMEM165/GDT1 family protein n=1 Tax=Salinibaculum TaxID=2732368 RepID=UPI0030D05E53